jgi:hypothetical protein
MNRYRGGIEALRKSSNPVVRLKILRDVLGETDSKAVARLQAEIRDHQDVKVLLSERRIDGSIRLPPYQKWNGPHWVLVMLAELQYPSGDRKLAPLRDQVYDWIDSNEVDPPAPEHGLWRVHASVHANVVWSTVTLGIHDPRVDGIVAKILKYQWPDGGWNCDSDPKAKHSSFTHSSIALRGLAAYAKQSKSAEVRSAVDRGAELFLSRQLYLRKTTGKPIRPDFTILSYPYFHMYNLLFGLKIMGEAGRIKDKRCDQALDLLESRFIADKGFKIEKKHYHHTKGNVRRYTPVRWEGAKLGVANQYLTADALIVLKQAGRL